ncbi:MAG TPA: thiolase domain-containing protein [Candidatus Caldiarchaeum subterraneum]|uniref:Thiolase domain-containing protein n=1 Tax=Caldiarchaeum subterraneum TaxID=311458 RepID=A0A833ECX6_CALS0|nr:thiolase domain-containing protein [Candidatus Caldarchaeum subterraneum]
MPYIVAAGMSRIAKRKETGAELFLEAFREIKEMAEINEVDAVYVGVQSENYEHQIMYGALLAEYANLLPCEAYRVEACAASGALALHNAYVAVKSGMYKRVLAVGVEKMSGKKTEEVIDLLMAASDYYLDQLNGVTIPAHYAMIATRYMHDYGATEEDLFLVAKKNHDNAMKNPKAYLRKSITYEEYVASKPVAKPIKMLDCSPICDGAAVALVVDDTVVSEYSSSQPVKILASTVASDTLSISKRHDITTATAVKLACEKAYRQAGLKPKNIHVAEVHDAFTINEIIIYEAMGYAEKGEGYKLLREEVTTLYGEKPVNPSGGLKARGHPIGATGLAQVYELYMQLTGRAEQRQVDAETGIAINEGGVNSTAVVHILEAA